MIVLKIIDVNWDIPYDHTPFYAVVFFIAAMFLLIAFSRRKTDQYRMEYNSEPESYDVLSQPITPVNLDQYPKEGVLFNTGASNSFLKNFLYSFLALLIFGILVCLFY